MPIYQFTCDHCGLGDERLISLADFDVLVSVQRCESCGQLLRKVVTPCALRTTTRFMSGSGDGLPDDTSRRIAYAKARAAGVNISGKKFHPGLCPKGEPFSPKAWYGDESEVRRKAAALGRGLEGAINAAAPIFDHDLAANEKPYRIATHLVREDVDREIAECHGGKVTPEKRREITERHRDKHSGNQPRKGKVSLAP